MFNKIRLKYNEYLDWFELERDKDCDYETEPYTYGDFEDGYYDAHENDKDDRRD